MSRIESPVYLFGKKGFSALKNFIEPGMLFAFDLDGTLAPIVSDPAAIGISAPVQNAFTRLAEQAAAAVITGRSRADAFKYLGRTPRYLLGNHGVEGLPEWQARENEFARTVKGWLNQLNDLCPVAPENGIFIENKGFSLSIHYRQTQNRQAAQNMILSAIQKLSPQPRRIGGKCVENLLPADAPDKGAAFLIMMHQGKYEKGFFVGDDETDESVFRLDQQNIFTVRVEKAAPSSAKFYLRKQSEIARLLNTLNKLLESHNEIHGHLKRTPNQKEDQ